MPSFLLDTNFCVHFMRGRTWARSALAKMQVVDAAISAITVGELYEGAHRSEFTAKEIAKTEAFLKPFCIIPFGEEEAMEWGLIEARLRKEGNPNEAEDSKIAATAHKHNLTLVTGNLKHFARVNGLRVVDWEQHPPKP